MKYLSNILIIDDDLEQALALKTFFNTAHCYPMVAEPVDIKENFSFHPDIVCCDITLNTLGDEEQNFKTISGLLKKIFKKKKEYIFVAWTSGNNDLFKRLKSFISADLETPQPMGFYCFSKATFTLDKLEKSISKIRKDIPGLDMLQHWKMVVNEAVEKSISDICSLSKKQKIKIDVILKLLASKTIGEYNLKDNEGKTLNLFLQYILRDYVEKQISITNNDTIKELSKPLENKKISFELEALLNSYLHVDITPYSSSLVYPGSFYKIQQNDLWKLVFGKKVLKNGMFDEDKLKKAQLEILRMSLKNTLKLKKTLQRDVRNNEIKDIKDEVIWGCLDITADCDFSNNKAALNKCVLAFLTPLNKKHLEASLSTSPNYIRYKISIEQSGTIKYYWLVICCKYLLGLQKEDLLAEPFVFRLRDTLLTYVRNNIFEHNSRIGTISF